MTFALTVVGAALAVGLELLEALAIVLAVGVTRRFRDALIGAGLAALALALLAGVLGPVILARIPLDGLRVVIGVLLLLFGLEWLRKGVLRLAGRRSSSSSFREFVQQQEKLEQVELPAPGRADWAARIVAFKGVLLEGVEVILIVTALGARPGGLAPALLGSVVALVIVLSLGVRLRAPLSRVPETHLKYLVGIVLSSFGVFFAAEGMGVEWPLADAALLYLAAAFFTISQAQIHVLTTRPAAVSEA